MAGLAIAGGATAQVGPAPLALVGEEDDGRVLRLPVGAELRVRLPEQGGSSPHWQLRAEPRMQQIGAETVERLAGEGTGGERQYRVFRLAVAGTGRIPVTLALRPAADGQRPARRVLYTVDAYRPGGAAEPAVPPDVLNEADAGRLVSVARGAAVTIRLPSNASTGYAWQLLTARNAAVAEPILETRYRGRPIGGGGTSQVRVTFERPGAAEVTLGYLPPGRPGASAAVRTLRFRFRVE